jgi:hypothetical protein
VDNDCNGQTDEDYVPSGTTCGVGACAATGTKTCVSGQEVDSCTPGTPVTEVCGDDLDNDCDGSTDEYCGCTYTQGYWKTHSDHGPAPEDDRWYNIGDVDGDHNSEGADETFFISGQTWYQVITTNPRGGNTYYQLAHQYIAAELNIASNAATTVEVEGALGWADTKFFNLYTPAQVGDSKTFDKGATTKGVRDQASKYATLLDRYNNGLIGPEHCD